MSRRCHEQVAANHPTLAILHRSSLLAGRPPYCTLRKAFLYNLHEALHRGPKWKNKRLSENPITKALLLRYFLTGRDVERSIFVVRRRTPCLTEAADTPRRPRGVTLVSTGRRRGANSSSRPSRCPVRRTPRRSCLSAASSRTPPPVSGISVGLVRSC